MLCSVPDYFTSVLTSFIFVIINPINPNNTVTHVFPGRNWSKQCRAMGYTYRYKDVQSADVIPDTAQSAEYYHFLLDNKMSKLNYYNSDRYS